MIFAVVIFGGDMEMGEIPNERVTVMPAGFLEETADKSDTWRTKIRLFPRTSNRFVSFI